MYISIIEHICESIKVNVSGYREQLVIWPCQINTLQWQYNNCFLDFDNCLTRLTRDLDDEDEERSLWWLVCNEQSVPAEACPSGVTAKI